MIKENNTTEYCNPKEYFKKSHRCHCHNNACSNPIYGLGVVGALFYFLPHATTFGTVMIGIGKSIFWPAIFMFKLLTFLQM